MTILQNVQSFSALWLIPVILEWCHFGFISISPFAKELGIVISLQRTQGFWSMPMSFAPHLVIDGRPHCTYVVSSYPITGAFLASVLKQPLCTLGCISYLVKVIANFLLWASFTVLSLSFFQLTTVCRNIECFIVFHAQSSLCLLPQAYLSMLSSWIIASVAGLPPPLQKKGEEGKKDHLS